MSQSISAELCDTSSRDSIISTVMDAYFPRHLEFTDPKGESCRVDESEMLSMPGPKVVLGEPGMGKSELLREAGRRLQTEPVSAVRFMNSKAPQKFVMAGKPLLIDGLDEAMVRHEGDAVDQILAQLEAAGSPEFILSCRSREWQSRNATNLRQVYGFDPTIFALEHLSRIEAKAFLIQRFCNTDPEHVLVHLDEHGLAELYRNPLTLSLMGQVAEHDTHLPPTRAALFERVTTLIWSEHDPERQDGSLGTIPQEQALSAAGAIMAGLLLAGGEAVSLAGPLQLKDRDIRLTDLQMLPEADAAKAVFSSKLFQSFGVGRAKPIHKVIAEYLGARWLAHQATTPRGQRRLLAQLQGSGGVPASLRGLHAWLAVHSPAMAERIIAADPFGVLRYGDAANLTPAQADCLFNALCALAEIDPMFRATDWDTHTAAGLMIPRLRHKIETLIKSADSNEHLRSLLIEGLVGSPLAVDLKDALEEVMFSRRRFYREREAAARALLPCYDRRWWRLRIDDLRAQGTEDSTRLALNLIEDIGCEVSNDLYVATLFAEIGLTVSPLPPEKQPRALRIYSRIVESLPASRIVDVLELISDYVELLGKLDWESGNSVAEIVSRLFVRAIDEDVIELAHSAMMWRWLGTLELANHVRGNGPRLKALLDQREDLRHAIQTHALYIDRPRPTILQSEFTLNQRMVGLLGRPKDVICHLERLAGKDNQDPGLREDWRDLMGLGIGANGFDAELRIAGQKFQRGDKQLEAFVQRLENPKKPAWQIQYERQAAKREKKRRIAKEARRRSYMAHRTALCAGDLGAILAPAQAYLGLFSELKNEQPPAERIAEWLDSNLRDDAMVGLEEVLHRSDLPSPSEVTKGFAEGRTWNYCFAIMAGLLARQRAGKDFADLSAEVRTIGLLLCHNDPGMCADEDLSALREELEVIVIPTAKEREDFARLWVEASLAASCPHVAGLYMLGRDEAWQLAGAKLAEDWLTRFDGLPQSVELELVDCLIRSGKLAELGLIAAGRSIGEFHDLERRFAWLAIDVLVRFDEVLPDLTGIGARNPEFIWPLRNRLQLEHRGRMLPLTVAQAKWIISEFRSQWAYAVLAGSGSGSTNPYDATDFIRSLIGRIANDTSIEASEAMGALMAASPDSYSTLIRHMAAEQRQKKAEEDFAPLEPRCLSELLDDGPPANIDDLKSLVVEELHVARKKLVGDDLDQIRDFWNEDGTVPYEENRCRDRLAAMITPELVRYDIQRVPEADMPSDKRADLAFSRGQLQLPMEVKGQWHPDVWNAATGQLDLHYLIDWRSEQRGIYCVLWFGHLPSKTCRRLQLPPDGLTKPRTADEMRDLLVARIPEARRAMIDVVVLDLAAGKS